MSGFDPLGWFASRQWKAFDFQREVWQAMAAGDSGLLHATTGSGKTYAVWWGALLRAARLSPRTTRATHGAPPLGILWITPMRALAADTTLALQAVLGDVAPTWTLGQRSGDTPAGERTRQNKRWPTALVTTPESLSLMLTRDHAAGELHGVHTVVVDEWHELMANKRGVQVQLALARLRAWNPELVVWGLSATLGNLPQALHVLLGQTEQGTPRAGRLVQGAVPKALSIDTLLPLKPGRFSWAGHLGSQMLAPVVKEIDSASTALVFTNTRSQAELWYQMLLEARPDWAGIVALHHASLDIKTRRWVEQGLKAGELKAVVATSSLDLGVDFLPVERVLQIGSVKGVARLLQRAGRSGHAPGRPSRITLVPTNTLELIEAAAARHAVAQGNIEARRPPEQPLDVLVQHLVTVALGGGFEREPLYAELRLSHAYRDLTPEAFDWAVAFVERGGHSLTAYPQYHRVVCLDGVYRVPDRGIALRHKMTVGTLTGNTSMTVKYLRGATIGTVDENFIARLRPGDGFLFGGRLLEYVRTQDMTAYVKKTTQSAKVVPRWFGGQMPLSIEMAESVLQMWVDAGEGRYLHPEMQAARPMLETQARLSRLPHPERLLVERLTSREGHHLFIYPFAGRDVHLGLASLLAWRLAREAPNTFSLSVNDHGLEILSAEPPPLDSLRTQTLFSEADLLPDLLQSLHSSELAQRRFRAIARIAGLIFTGYPGRPQSTRQLQASSSLFFEVFKKHDPENMLLAQAHGEVLQHELDVQRLGETLAHLRRLPLAWVDLPAASPLCLPLMVERLREKLSTETLADRLARMVRDAEKIADRRPLPALHDNPTP
ncbi:MAG: ligase-associated DNA damage response DEXH box helicase [Pseudomonadota bacterium]